MRARHAGGVVVALVGLGAGTAAAQTVVYPTGFDPDRYVTTSDPDAIALTESASPLDEGRWAAGFALRLGGAPLSVCVEEHLTGTCTEQGDLVSSRFAADLGAAIGFGRFGVHAQLPVVVHQGSDFDAAPSGGELSSAQVGDLRIGGKVRIARRGATTIGADLTGSIPTGGGDSLIGDRGTVIEGKALIDWRRGKLAGAAAAGYAWRSHAARLGDLYLEDELLWSLAGQYAVAPDLTAGLALFGRVGVASDPAPMMAPGTLGWEERPAEVMASADYRLSRHLSLEAGAGTALGSGYGGAPFRAVVGLRWEDRREAPPARLPVVVAAPTPPPPTPTPPPVIEPAAVEAPAPEPAPPPVEEPALAVLTAEAIEIRTSIEFASDRATIEANSDPLLDDIAEILGAHPGVRVRIEGHTDDTGKASWNLTLSQRRAEAVRDALVARGVAADRVEAAGFGSSRPRTAGKSRAARRDNRRVELIVID